MQPREGSEVVAQWETVSKAIRWTVTENDTGAHLHTHIMHHIHMCTIHTLHIQIDNDSDQIQASTTRNSTPWIRADKDICYSVLASSDLNSWHCLSNSWLRYIRFKPSKIRQPAFVGIWYILFLLCGHLVFLMSSCRYHLRRCPPLSALLLHSALLGFLCSTHTLVLKSSCSVILDLFTPCFCWVEYGLCYTFKANTSAWHSGGGGKL